MDDAGADAKRRVHDAIQATAAAEDDLEGQVLVGWIVIAEWAAGDGSRSLSRLAAAGDGVTRPTSWAMKGYLHDALEDLPGGWSDT